ncbi:aminoglycoside phosphotransferase family protein [candidate division KSB1 bacterium]|nr:aminoglycoside phosphotransferase family protein [candidate division KSB1 bacterium]
MPSDRRYPHQPFDPSLIGGFLRGREILSAALLPTGKSNTNYKLILSDGETCVLRLYSRGNAERETYVMHLVKELVPVPVELARGESWAVFSFLDGELLENVPEHSGAAAEALAKLASVVFKSRGWINADGSTSPFSFGGTKGFIAEKLEDAKVRAWLEQETVDAIFTILENECARLDELDAESRLVHGDFNPTNILIHRGKVSGILDWEFCHSGTPYMDIGNLLRHTASKYHREIKLGLEAGGMNLPGDWRERAELVDLTSHLEFLTSDRSEEFKRLCVGRIERFIVKFKCGA